MAVFEEVKSSLNSLDSEVEKMNKSVTKMRQTLQQNQSQTMNLIGQTNDLQIEKKKLQIDLDIATLLIERFTLSPMDQQILYGQSRDEKISSEFFR